MSTIATRITESRKAKGLTMTAVADALSITVTGVSNWEKGKFKPRPEMLINLAKVLGVDPHYLEFGKEMEAKVEAEADTAATVASILAATKAEIAAVTKMPLSAIKLDLNFSV